MKIVSIGTGNSKSSDLEKYKLIPEFRKATKNMISAYASIEEAVQPLVGRQEGYKNFGLVLGSYHGELDITLQFLKHYKETGIGRPLLFQNSLHNATTGFIALKLGLTGPTITVSNQDLTQSNSLEVASLLLRNGDCLFCLVTLVDSFLDLGTTDAVTHVLATEKVARDLKIPILGRVENRSQGGYSTLCLERELCETEVS